MRRRLLEAFGVAAVLMAVTVLLKLAPVPVAGQTSGARAKAGAAANPASTSRTPWGELDLQGIWTEDLQTPLHRPARYANKEFFTEAERIELDQQRDRPVTAVLSNEGSSPPRLRSCSSV